MRKSGIIFLVIVLIQGIMLSQVKKVGEKTKQTSVVSPFKTEPETNGYAIGYSIGESMKRFSDKLALKTMIQGLQDAFEKDKGMMADSDIESRVKVLQEAFQKAANDEKYSVANKNQADGEKFLKENGQKKGVVTTKSGLEYMVIKTGTGPKPAAEDQVKVHLIGTLVDGQEFDNTYKTKQPMVLNLKDEIVGLREGITLMNVGSKFKLWIPMTLAYGPVGRGPSIGPLAMLTYEIELLGIEKGTRTPLVQQNPPIAKPTTKPPTKKN